MLLSNVKAFVVTLCQGMYISLLSCVRSWDQYWTSVLYSVDNSVTLCTIRTLVSCFQLGISDEELYRLST
jgi:hypothetical protein